MVDERRQGKREVYKEESSKGQIENRASVRHALWEDMKSPTAALEEAPRRTEEEQERLSPPPKGAKRERLFLLGG